MLGCTLLVVYNTLSVRAPGTEVLGDVESAIARRYGLTDNTGEQMASLHLLPWTEADGVSTYHVSGL